MLLAAIFLRRIASRTAACNLHRISASLREVLLIGVLGFQEVVWDGGAVVDDQGEGIQEGFMGSSLIQR